MCAHKRSRSPLIRLVAAFQTAFARFSGLKPDTRIMDEVTEGACSKLSVLVSNVDE